MGRPKQTGRVGGFFCLLHDKQWVGWSIFFVYYIKNKAREGGIFSEIINGCVPLSYASKSTIHKTSKIINSYYLQLPLKKIKQIIISKYSWKIPMCKNSMTNKRSSLGAAKLLWITKGKMYKWGFCAIFNASLVENLSDFPL